MVGDKLWVMGYGLYVIVSTHLNASKVQLPLQSARKRSSSVTIGLVKDACLFSTVKTAEFCLLSTSLSLACSVHAPVATNKWPCGFTNMG